MSGAPILVGDTVRLNSGGPEMAVERITGDGRLLCAWYHKDGYLDKQYFRAPSLTLISGERAAHG